MGGGPVWTADRYGQEEALSEVREQGVKDWAGRESRRAYEDNTRLWELCFHSEMNQELLECSKQKQKTWFELCSKA